MVLSYGFNYFWTASYSLTNVTAVQSKKVGEEVTLICQADDFWEWCRYRVLSLQYIYTDDDMTAQTLSFLQLKLEIRI